jgi:hypothetical protein
MQKLIISAVIVVTILAIIATVAKTNTKVELQQIDVKTKQQEIQTLKQDQSDYEQRLKEAHGDKKKLEQLKLEQKRLQDENKRLQSELQAKLDKQAMEAENVAYASPQAVTAPTGDWVAQCHAWASQAGIVLTDSAIQLLERESHCNHTAQNPTSSACGIAQNINGCGSAGYGYDPISQLTWFHNYCQSRYGGFDGALAHSLSNNWY